MNASEEQRLAAEFELLEVAPDDDDERVGWRTDLVEWRKRVRAALPADDRYGDPATAWARTAFVCGVAMLWDEELYDPDARRFRVDAYLDLVESDFGHLDAVMLWHAYPRIGFDERNQFDFYRDLPGGLDALKDLIDRLHARGTRAILDYNPWDTGTRQEAVDDVTALAELMTQVGADGVFLDTLADASGSLIAAFERVGAPVVLQSEHVVPLTGLHDHLMSWAQWPDRLEQRLVLRNAWAEPRQMQHVVRRWHEDHLDELFAAWLNGTGVVVWENVFGSWYPWNPHDKAVLRSMRPVQQRYGRTFADGVWTPFVATSSRAVDASRWDLDGTTVWTLVNRSAEPVRETVMLRGRLTGTARAEVGALEAGADGLEVVVQPRSVACVVAGDASPGTHPRATTVTRPVRRPYGPVVVPSGSRDAPREWRRVAATESGPARFRLRECGAYDRAPFVDQRYPDLSGDIVVDRPAAIAPFAIAPAPVTNAEFLRFLDATGYAPDEPTRFLEHWEHGAPAPGTGNDPVVWVDLTDARAFARWHGSRLPTEDEWQVALSGGAAGYGARRVWEWTESEQSDGHSRFAVLKGGSDLKAAGSDWYAEGGPLAPDRSAKFLLFSPSIDRCSTIGFRCARDRTGLEAGAI